MSSEETELSRLAWLVRRRWRLILAPATVAAGVGLVAAGLLAPPRYEATTLLAVHPRLRGDLPYSRSIRVQRSLTEGDAVVRRTAEALAEGGAGQAVELAVGRELSTRVVNMKDGVGLSPVLALTARRDSPERAAATANAWARIAIAESRAMFARRAPADQAWLDLMAGRIEKAARRLAALDETRERPSQGIEPAQGESVPPAAAIELARRRLEELTKEVELRTVVVQLKQEEPLTVISAALPPIAPVPRRLPTVAATAAFLGGMLGLMVVLVRGSRPL